MTHTPMDPLQQSKRQFECWEIRQAALQMFCL
jgi:hypothetical protein